MNADQLKALQAPLKEQYKVDPDSALITLRAKGRATDAVACKVETGRATVEAGLHPATGGDGSFVCSGDMLLEALVACAGVTLRAVATSIGIDLRDATVTAEGDLDFRGTLGVAKEAPGWISAHPSRVCTDNGRLGRAAGHADSPDRTLLRRLPDAPARAGDQRHADDLELGPCRAATRSICRREEFAAS